MTRFARLLLLSLLLPAGVHAAVPEAPVLAEPEAPVVMAPEAAPDVVPAPLPEGFAGVLARRLAEESRAVAGRTVDLDRLRRFYTPRAFAPAWIDDGAGDAAVKASARAVLEGLRGADADGLSVADYHADAIAQRLNGVGEKERAELELLLSDAVMRYAAHVRAGRLAPKTISGDFAEVTPPAVDVPALAAAVSTAEDAGAALAALAPARADYVALKDALKRLRALEAAGGWPLVPAPRAAKLEPGMRDPAVKALRKRLAVTGEFDSKPDAKAAASEVYDPALRKAVERFQARHGLFVDGVVGATTVAALNVPVGERVGQLVANLERLRWLPDSFGARHVLVNVPDFTLKAVDGGTVVHDMRVIVGTKVRRTPILSSQITSVVLNPTWTVPVKLAKEDYLAKFIRDPGYPKSHGFTVYSGWSSDARPLDAGRIDWKSLGAGIARLRLRQDPGPQNALGQVKFNIPNGFDVYLHDTPSREKFDKTVRTFSSGCVRVGRPLDLADFVLSGTPDWPAERRQAQLEKGETKTVVLKAPVSVHILYQTAWVDAAGTLQFREDIYGRDGEFLELLARKAMAGQKLADARG